MQVNWFLVGRAVSLLFVAALLGFIGYLCLIMFGSKDDE